MDRMNPAIRFAVSYRSLSDSALVSCADSEVADALGIPVDEVDQQQLDHDTTVESIGVDRGDSLDRYFLAAQVMGVSMRSRHGLVDHVMPPRLHNTLMSLVHDSLVHDSAETPEDMFSARRTTAWVPVSELMSPWSTPHLVRRPAHEVKAVCAALDDLAIAFSSGASRRSSLDSWPDLGASLRCLLDDLADADGLPVPLAVSRTAQTLVTAPEPLRDVTVPVGEAVFDLATTESWDSAASILRDARRRLVGRRTGHGPNA
ncbi:MAG: hypothetical protein RL726_1747 [Actinomycetota bacterium]|jgi:hypothetical protein